MSILRTGKFWKQIVSGRRIVTLFIVGGVVAAVAVFASRQSAEQPVLSAVTSTLAFDETESNAFQRRHNLQVVAEAGDIAAAVELAGMLYRGEGGARDLSQAKRLYEQAAHAGNASAKRDLASMLYLGEGGKYDAERARRLYKEAADAGDLPATCHFAAMLYAGEGGPQDVHAAIEQYREAAAAGSTEAQRNLLAIEQSED